MFDFPIERLAVVRFAVRALVLQFQRERALVRPELRHRIVARAVHAAVVVVRQVHRFRFHNVHRLRRQHRIDGHCQRIDNRNLNTAVVGIAVCDGIVGLIGGVVDGDVIGAILEAVAVATRSLGRRRRMMLAAAAAFAAIGSMLGRRRSGSTGMFVFGRRGRRRRRLR